MRLLSVRVSGYGPLEDVDLEPAPGLNVVHGANEAGKTTLLDFLLSHLFRWEQRSGRKTATLLEGMNRFGEPPEGAGGVELRLDGDVRSYPGEGPSLLHELGLEYAGLTGLFCVRSGEMELPGKDEGEFWAELKKVLSGLPEGVDTLRERAHDEAGLTPTGKLSDAGSPGRRTRLRRLRQRADELDRLAGRLEEISEVADEMSRLEERHRRLEAARDARIAELYAALGDARETLEELPGVPSDALERWERLAGERRRLEGELEEARAGLEEARAALEGRREELEEAEDRADALQDRLREVRRKELEDRARRLAEAEPPGALVQVADPLYWAGWVVLGLAIGPLFLLPSATLGQPAWLLGLLVALVVGAGLFFGGRRLRRRRDAATEERVALQEDAAACGLEVSSPAGIPDAVRRLESRAHEAGGRREAARARAESARERRDERAGAVEEREGRLGEIGDEVADLGEALGTEGLEDVRARTRERAEVEDRAEQIEAELQGLAGREEASWRVDPPDVEDPPEWSASDYQEVEARLRELRERHRELSRAFDRAGLDEPEDALPELQRCRSEIREIERDRDAGRIAGEIFATMDEALEARLSEALTREGDHSVRALVRRITGRYSELRRGDDGALVVRDEAGRTFPLARLSRGARDQVHLALRLGLAGAALEAADLEEPGFFLLDDAFLTADWERRERLVEAVAGLAGEGWQIVYLTCDDHLRDLFTAAGAELYEL